MHHHDTPRVPTPGDVTDAAIVSAHIIDDLTTALATARRALADTVWAIGIARDANTNAVGDVVAEYLDRADLTASRALSATAGAGCLP